MAQPVWKTVQQFLKKFNIELPYDQQFSLLVCPKDLKAEIQTDKCTPLWEKTKQTVFPLFSHQHNNDHQHGRLLRPQNMWGLHPTSKQATSSTADTS